MARKSNLLTAKAVDAAKSPGRYSDGGGLYLIITKALNRKWVFRYIFDGKARELGLGSLKSVTLAQARARADAARRKIADGIDPIEEKRAVVVEIPTFGECADDYIETHKASWKNEKHIAQWQMTLREYAAPLRKLPVDKVDTEAVLKVLKPIWLKKNETASRLRGRIESVLNAAKAKGFRSGENPALWRGHLDQLLPKTSSLARGHHKALPIDELPSFMAALRARPELSARALEFAILTAARSGEALNAAWSELDLENEVWTIPAERMKAKREHRVPLCGRALEILRELREVATDNPYVFPGRKPNRPLSDMALEMTLRRMKVDVTAHGFRSTFKDWSMEHTAHPGELSEMALAHAVRDKTEKAYRRGDLFKKRHALMADWDAFCGSGEG